jgi:transmembrane sensor
MTLPQSVPAAAVAADSGIDPALVQRAAEWMARLWSGEASDADRAACAAWRAADAMHEQAWQRLHVIEQKLGSVPTGVARQALRESAPSASMVRRRAMQLLGLGITVGGLGYAVRGSDPWALVLAQYRTGTGEIRSLILPDGTRLMLASASAVDLRYTEQERLIVLRAGEILLTSAPDRAASYRPLRVRSPQGVVQALGTRFMVRQDGDASRVAVFEGAVEVRPARDSGTALRLEAGQGTRFTADAVQPASAVQEGLAAWSRGLLLADAMPLAEVVKELARYRPGLLRCDPAVAGLRVSGVFSLRDTDRALHNLTLALPVAIAYRTRYWVTVGPR